MLNEIHAHEMPGNTLIEMVGRWAPTEPLISAVIVVGSYARGDARPDSDVDIILLCKNTRAFLSSYDWLAVGGRTRYVLQKAYRTLTTLEVRYEHGLRAEFGIAPEEWAQSTHEEEIRSILQSGMNVIFDSGLLTPAFKDVIHAPR